MILTLWRLLTLQIDYRLAQDDTELRKICDQARYDDNIEPARKALKATSGDYDRRARYVRVLAESTVRGSGPKPDPQTGQIDTGGTWADQWAARCPDDPDAQLVRAGSLRERAWEIRGGHWASTVRPEQWAEFDRLLPLAEQAINLASHLAPRTRGPHPVGAPATNHDRPKRPREVRCGRS
ncbi:DUF4034 domain-containing protein [Salinispora fenicalii]|uniref:DUF4034 domain-containing protein n=1 Tax=Salinispora fenicalii TaxID=1137263 RepID=UPI001CC57803|nr:DUF4034 domain-containing protein [Salinispora fenicalii]